MQSFYIINIQYDPYLSNIINNIFVVKQVRFYIFFHALPKWNFNSFNFSIVSRIWLGLSDTFCAVFPSGQLFDIICRCPFIPISLKFGISKKPWNFYQIIFWRGNFFNAKHLLLTCFPMLLRIVTVIQCYLIVMYSNSWQISSPYPQNKFLFQTYIQLQVLLVVQFVSPEIYITLGIPFVSPTFLHNWGNKNILSFLFNYKSKSVLQQIYGLPVTECQHNLSSYV